MKLPNCCSRLAGTLVHCAFTMLATSALFAGARVVAVDQLGYLPKGSKFVFSSQPATGFSMTPRARRTYRNLRAAERIDP